MSHCPSSHGQSHGNSHGHCHAHHGHDEHHVVSAKLLTGVFAALMVLTFLTVAAITVDFGPSYNLLIAIVIAAVKGFLVVYYFMHLKWDRAFHALCVVLSIAFVVMMIAYTKIDTAQFEGNVHVVDKQDERKASGQH